MTTVPSADVAAIPVDDIAAFAVGCLPGGVPNEVQDFGRVLLLDTIGAMLGGLRYPAVQQLGAALAGQIGDRAEAPFDRLISWGTAATWLDADSGGSFHPAGARMPPVPTAHPAPHALPVLLHAATAAPLTDAEVLHAFVIATEIGMRFGVGTSLRPGLHPHGIHGPIAAAVAAALLRGADARTLSHAIRRAAALPLAATLAVPMRGGTVRNLWTALGCYYGAVAAADSAPPDESQLDRLYGGAVCSDPDVPLIGGGLGARWEILNSYLKPFACARWIHPALEALAQALSEAGHPAAARIEAIEVDTFAFAASLNSRGAASDMHARFSLPRCLATLALDGRLDADGFLPGRFQRPELDRLMDRTVVREEPAFTAALPRERPTRVTVTVGGRRAVGEVRNASGNPDAPLSTAQVATKFRHNAGDILPTRLLDGVVAALRPGTDAASAGERAQTDSADGRADTDSIGALARALAGAGSGGAG